MEKVKYISEIKESNGIKIPVYKFVDVETDFTKQYKNSISSLFKLTPLATKYILFVTENMNNENIYTNNKYNKLKFIDVLKEAEDKVPNIGSLDKVAIELINKGFLFSLERGTYLVNPELFWKDNEKARINTIKLTLEFERNKEINIEINKK